MTTTTAPSATIPAEGTYVIYVGSLRPHYVREGQPLPVWEVTDNNWGEGPLRLHMAADDRRRFGVRADSDFANLYRVRSASCVTIPAYLADPGRYA